jgi:competence protein ComEA
MWQTDRAQVAVYVAAAIAIALIGARYLREARPGGEASGSGKPVPVRVSGGGGSSGGGPVVIQVAGEVRRPGVYSLRAGQRVQDAVRLAGGLTPRADLSAVNLAAKAEDGRQVVVPRRGAPAGAAAAPGAGAAAAGGEASAQGGPSALINLNTATTEQLETLDGIGPATAQKILAYRQEHGGFRSVAELDRVSGIGPAKMAALRDHVTV